MNATSIPIARCWSRLLIPFQLQWNRSPDATILAEAFRSSAPDWNWQGPVTLSDLHTLDDHDPEEKIVHSRYMREYIEHVVQFLFDGRGLTGCYYLRADADPFASTNRPIRVGSYLRAEPQMPRASNRPSPHGLAVLAASQPGWNDAPPPPATSTERRIRLGDCSLRPELWVSRLGLGLLSVPFHFEPADGLTSLDLNDVCDVHHALATGQRAVWIDAVDPPSNQTPVHVHEIARQLLAPLKHLGTFQCQSRGLIYSSLQMIVGDGLSASATEDVLQALAMLAQIAPSSHPGGMPLENVFRISHEHLGVIDLQGAAHATLVHANYSEPRKRDFAQERAKRTQIEYFPGYLLAVMQRLCLQELLQRAATAVSGEFESRKIDEIHRLAQAFSLEGEFVQVSWRGSLQSFHESAQRACEVEQGLRTVREALDAFDRQTRALESESREHESHRAERNMQMLEVFLVAVYAVAVAHYLSEGFGFHNGPLTGWLLVGVLLASILAVVGQITRGDEPSHPATFGFLPNLRVFWDWAGRPLICKLLLIHILYLGTSFAIHYWHGGSAVPIHTAVPHTGPTPTHSDKPEGSTLETPIDKPNKVDPHHEP